MARITSSFAAFILAFFAPFAACQSTDQNGNGKGGATVTLSSTYKSDYVPDNAGNPHDGGVVQSDVQVCFENGFCIDPWLSLGTDGKSGGAREFDLTGSYTSKWFLGEFTVGLQLVDFAPLTETNGVLKPFVGTTFKTFTKGRNSLTPRVEFDYLVTNPSTARNSGAFIQAAVTDVWKLRGESVALVQTLKGVEDTGVFHSSATVIDYSAVVSIAFHGVTFQPGFRRTQTIIGPDRNHNIFLFGVSKTLTHVHLFR